MNGVVRGPRSRSIRSSVMHQAIKIVRLLWLTVIFPVRSFLAVRRALTPASVTLLLIGIVSTNIIWGYPWIGVFSACVSLFIVGFLLNRWSLPNLESDYVVPRSAVAGTPFQAKMILSNPGRFPALELDVATKLVNRDQSKRLNPFEVRFSGRSIPMIQPGGRDSLNANLLCQTRGIHQLPDVLVTSWFPFHLFKYTRRVETSASIPITPKLLTTDDDMAANGMLDSLGNWTRKLLSGDALDYTGSREYVSGMPVRRWDFLAWARIGQPIIREYQSPSVRTVAFIVDTATESNLAGGREQSTVLLERVLSLAATAVEHICRQPIQIRLFVTGHDDSIHAESRTDRESLLIRLAAANPEKIDRACRAITEICELNDRLPVLIITSRIRPMGDGTVPATVSILRAVEEVASRAAIDQNEDQVHAIQGRTNHECAQQNSDWRVAVDANTFSRFNI